MSAIAFPAPDLSIIRRRPEILAGLAALVPAEALITAEDELRPYESDALTAFRKMPLAAMKRFSG